MIKKLLMYISNFGIGIALGFKIGSSKKQDKTIAKNDKYLKYYYLLSHWLFLRNNGVSIESRLLEQEIKSVAIYGMGEIGNRLYEELENSSIDVKYAIDAMPKYNNNIKILRLGDNLEQVDMIIVSAIFDYDNIAENIRGYCNYRIVSLEDIIFNDF